MIVEDEFSNMFSTMRAFLTRGKEQSFVNVFSEDYMLRDYMRFNQQIFLTDPGGSAIPGAGLRKDRPECADKAAFDDDGGTID